MSGICGYAGASPDEALLRRMAARLVHRGPDGEGFLLTPRVGLGVRRLCRVDSEEGRRPLLSEDRHVALVLDGEIYNHAQLREQLQARGHRFASRSNAEVSDAEVLVHLYEEQGRDALLQLRGNFALALYDGRRRSLLLARDRLGIKPLYCTLRGERLLFASELKALLADSAVSATPHLPSIDAYLRLRYVPGPDTLISGIWRLPPGCWLEWRDGRVQSDHYWRLPARSHADAPPARSLGEVDDERRFADLLRQSWSLCRGGEEPLETYPSGGLDSVSVTADDLRLLPEIVYALEEPQADVGVVSTYLGARHASQRLKVVSSDAGADELLADSTVHRVLDRVRRYRGVVPGWLHRALLAPAASVVPGRLLGSIFDWSDASFDGGNLGRTDKQRLLRLVQLAAADELDIEAAHGLLITLFDDRERGGLYTSESAAALAAARVGELDDGWSDGPAIETGDAREPNVFLDRLLHLQLRDWLPDNILQRKGKLTMAHGLELCMPFLDHELVEFLATVPASLKLQRSAGKSLLRGHAARSLGQEYAGQALLRGGGALEREPAFRELLDQTLTPERVARRGLFRPEAVATLTFERVLSLSILELWYQIFVDGSLQPRLSVVDRAERRPASWCRL